MKTYNSIIFTTTTKLKLENHPELVIEILNKSISLFKQVFNQRLMALYYDLKGFHKIEIKESSKEKLFDKIRAKEIPLILITEYMSNKEFYGMGVVPERLTSSLGCGFALNDSKCSTESKFSDGFCFGISDFLIDNDNKHNVLALVKDFFFEVSKKIEGINGCIAREYCDYPIGMFSSNFDFMYYISQSFFSEFYDTFIRGYFWGNLLSEKHIEKLGGIKRIKNEAPCFIVEEKTIAGKQTVYLQLTEDAFCIKESEIRALRDYLLPLFPPESKRTRYRYTNRLYYDKIKNKEGYIFSEIEEDIANFED